VIRGVLVEAGFEELTWGVDDAGLDLDRLRLCVVEILPVDCLAQGGLADAHAADEQDVPHRD